MSMNGLKDTGICGSAGVPPADDGGVPPPLTPAGGETPPSSAGEDAGAPAIIKYERPFVLLA
jgi:hypothetical protein